MIINVYSLKDELVGFNRPVVFENDNVAVRSFTQLMLSDDYKKLKKDFSLYKLGTYDDQLGQLIPLPFPEKIVDGNSLNNEVYSNE